ncbi:MAG: hypothetical protein LAN70_14440 [Acidobacteriia bacterium]|nr:hypothetical protein [Terriglobia bacterium]
MAEEKLDYTAKFINHIKAKIAALQAVLASVESATALGALGQPLEGMKLAAPSVTGRNDAPGVPTDLPKGAFMGKSVPVCVELYLSAVKEKKTNKEIAAALREGGVESKASNFENVVTGALFGLKKAGKVLRFKDGWGLASWYPAHIRGAAPASAKGLKKKAKKTQRAKEKAPAAKANTTVEVSTKISEIKPPEDKPEPRILGFFKANQREVTAGDVAKALGLKIQTTNLVLAKLAHQKKIEKLSSGQFKGLGAAS